MKDYRKTKNDIVLAIEAFTRSIDSSNDYRGDMSSLVQVTSNLKLVRLGYWERLIRSELDSNLYLTAQSKWARWFKPAPKLTWLDIVNADGYKREKSLRALSKDGAPNAFSLALAVRRLNDWVPQVRTAAREVLPSLLKSTEPKYVTEVLCMLLINWHSWGKMEEIDKHLFLDMVISEEMALLLKSRLISSTSGPMPSLLSQIGRTGILDNYLNEIASNAVQPYVRAKAFRCLFEGRLFWLERREFQPARGFYGQDTFTPIIGERKITVHVPLLDLLHRSANDHSSIVRKVAAEFVIRNIETLGSDARDFATRFTADSSDNVAEQGSYILKKLSEQDK